MIANSILIIVPFILQKMELHILSDSFTTKKHPLHFMQFVPIYIKCNAMFS